MNLILLTEDDRTSSTEFTVSGRRAEHIRAVLRAKPGDLLRAGLLHGKTGTARLLSLDRNAALLEGVSFDCEPPPKIGIVPVISLPRPQSFKKTLHFIASAGIPKAFFIGSARVEKSYWKSSAMEPSAILDELCLGLEQGMDTVPPVLEFQPSFRGFLKQLETMDFPRKIIAHPAKNAPECPHAVCGAICLAIGPEGGYVETEVEAFRSLGFECVTLGPHILRVEFALSVLCGRLCP